MERSDFKHIPDYEYERIVKRFMQFLRNVDQIYSKSQQKKLESEEICAVISGVVHAYFDGSDFSGRYPKRIFRKQIVSYFLNKYLNERFPMLMTKSQIGAYVGYNNVTGKSTHLHSMTIHNCGVIEDYIYTKDPKYYHEILDIGEKIKNVLT